MPDRIRNSGGTVGARPLQLCRNTADLAAAWDSTSAGERDPECAFRRLAGVGRCGRRRRLSRPAVDAREHVTGDARGREPSGAGVRSAGDRADALDASVIVATRSRAHLLRATLARLGQQVTGELRWEVVVVDNNDGGDDGTLAVLAAARATLPLVVLRESRPGKNRAMNRALPVARGKLLVFTDDDVEPVPHWLAEYVGAARRWPSHAVFGGPIVPRLPSTAPSWLATHAFAAAAFGRFEPAADEGPCTTLPFGSNLAIRAGRMAGLTFNEDFGTQGGRTDLMGAETELLLRLVAAGERSVFVPGARIAHVIEPHQTTPEWLFERAFRHGRTYLRLQGGRHPLISARLGARLAIRWLGDKLATRSNEHARIDAGIKLFHARGQLYEYLLGRPSTERVAACLLPQEIGISATTRRSEGWQPTTASSE